MGRTQSRWLKAVVFDLDGTLLDTAPEFITVLHQLREEHNLERLPEDFIRSKVSHGARALVTLSLGMQPEEEGFEEKRLRLLEIYSSILGTATRPYDGIHELLLGLAREGIAWGISTNKPSVYTYPLLATQTFNPAPTSVVCADQVSNPKPHPEALYLNCKQLGCEPREVIYIGDHLRDIEAGRAAGMCTIAAAYGYIEAGDNPADWGADAIAHEPCELARIIVDLNS
ncbi:MAG: HAD-IA family hydrolase [Gammaproteobacteria bacterium]|nr:HAD-IA family hydrolase [Gammaproteobacteria bacterium]